MAIYEANFRTSPVFYTTDSTEINVLRDIEEKKGRKMNKKKLFIGSINVKLNLEIHRFE